MSGLLGPVTANQQMLAQALKAREQPRKQLTGQGLLDVAASGLGPVPIVGDAMGLLADSSRFINEPESRTPLNFGLAALGLLPFVPSGVGAVKKMTQYEKAHEIAQKNAALPVEKGGLGLPPNNTAMDRARAMGFADRDFYHATTGDFDSFDLRKSGEGTTISRNEKAAFLTDKPSVANDYVANPWASVDGEVVRPYAAGGNVMPLKIRSDNHFMWDMGGAGYDAGFVSSAIKDAKKNKQDMVIFSKMKDPSFTTLGSGEKSNIAAVLDPSKIRSRFAAFDPFRRNENNLLANVAPFGLAGLLGLSLYDAKQGD